MPVGLEEEREASSAKSARSGGRGTVWGLCRSSAVDGYEEEKGDRDGDGGGTWSDVVTDLSHLRTSGGSGAHCSSRA